MRTYNVRRWAGSERRNTAASCTYTCATACPTTVEGNPFSVPTSTPIELVDNDQLEAVQEQFRTGAMSLGWDPTTAQVVIEAHPLTDVDADDNDEPLDDDGTNEPEMLLVRIPVGTARAFAKRTREIVGAGRPTCPLCGYPIDADGHICTLPEV